MDKSKSRQIHRSEQLTDRHDNYYYYNRKTLLSLTVKMETGKHSLPPHMSTLKLQLKYSCNNHHSKPSEIKLNRSLTIMKLKNPYPSRLVRGAEMQNGLVPHPHMVDKNSEGVSWERGIPHQPHTSPPSPGFPGVPGR